MASTIAWGGIFSSVREKSVAFHIAPRSGIAPDGVMIWSPAIVMSPSANPAPPTGAAGWPTGAGMPAPPMVGW
ncbi:hypothetical protein BSL84_20600 [Streptomyces sp. TN58]|nr:hypothetical protein BSL84_20600 [Streptomyces sp. TN58]